MIMTEADRLATFADIPHPLADLVVARAREMNIPLRELRRSDRRPEDLVKARKRIAAEARRVQSFGGRPAFSLWQIGRALNRDHSTVRYAIMTADAVE